MVRKAGSPLVRLRFGGGTVRAILVFGPAVPVQRGFFYLSVLFNGKGQFRFRFRFLENGSGGSGSAFGSGKNGSDSFRFRFGSGATLIQIQKRAEYGFGEYGFKHRTQ